MTDYTKYILSGGTHYISNSGSDGVQVEYARFGALKPLPDSEIAE